MKKESFKTTTVATTHIFAANISKMKVRFNIKDKNGLILLKFRYLPKRLPLVFSTRQHINVKDWNPKTMRAIVKSPIQTPHLVDLNGLLQRMEDCALSTYRQNVGRINLSDELFKDALNALFFGQQQVDKVSLSTFLKQLATDPKIVTNKNTRDNYSKCLALFNGFQMDSKLKVDFDNVDFDFLHHFKQYCFGRNYAKSTVGQYVANLKAAVNLGRKKGLTDNRIVGERGFSVRTRRDETNKVCLYEDELGLLLRLDVENIERSRNRLGRAMGFGAERLSRIRDIIIAGCLTGMRHSDLQKIRKENIFRHNGRDIIEVYTQKTGTPVAIPLLPMLVQVLEKYEFQLPTVSRGEVLRVGRDLLRLAGVVDEIEWRQTNGGKLKVTRSPKWQHFSAHVTRRTFATMFYLKDPTLLPVIRDILGHSTDRQTLNYINVEGRMNAEQFIKRIELQPKILRAVR